MNLLKIFEKMIIFERNGLIAEMYNMAIDVILLMKQMCIIPV